MENLLIPPSGRFTTPRVVDAWYPVARSESLGDRPYLAQLCGTPLVVFRGLDRRVTALLDRCAHRNVPLSQGRLCDGRIECAYHGWQYDSDGVCRAIPGLTGPQEGKARRVPAFATKEQQGCVWVWANLNSEPVGEPFRYPYLNEPDFVSVRYDFEVEATLLNAAENILDVPHTSFLHRGYFRKPGRQQVEVRVQRHPERVEAHFIGEPRPPGVVGRLLAPQGGTLTHIDMFLLPSVAAVDYRLGRACLSISNVLSPVDDFRTKSFTVASLRLSAGTRAIRRLVEPVAKVVAQQDADILRKLTRNTRTFGGEQFVSTELDFMGPHILRLLRQAERRDSPPADVTESRVQLLA